MGHLRNTLYMSTYSTNLTTRDRLRDYRNLRQSTAICRFLLYSAIFY
jgi:hypothetical protein